MIGCFVSLIFGPLLKGKYGIFSYYFISIFRSLTLKCKCAILRQCIVYDKSFINNDISNLVCTKSNTKNNFDRTFSKIKQQSQNIFRISPRALVFCVLHKNIEMLKYIQDLGYPLEMISYADNYSLVKKKNLERFIFQM